MDGTVYAVATQTDGKVLIAGVFANVGGVPRTNLARLNIDGSLDQTFTASANDKITSMVVQPDGSILIGGYFTSVTTTAGTTTRNRLARLTASGALDAGFDPNLGGVLAPGVEALLLQADGKVVAGGTFTTAQPNGAATATTRNRLARFLASGALDTGFDPSPDRVVLALAQQADGLLIVAGGFTKLQPNGATTATARNSVARLLADGSLDTTYDVNANNAVTKVVVQQDGKAIIGGYFTTLAPIGSVAVTTISHIARLNADSTIDPSYNPGVDGNITAMTLQRDGGVLIGGTFTVVQSTRRTYVARIGADGTLDNIFDPSANYTVFAIAEQSDGSIVLGGTFTQLQPNFAAAPTTRNHVARVNANGTLDSDFSPDTNGRVLALLVQSDGKALVGGSFTSIGGVTRNYFARLNADGSLDATFDPSCNGQVTALAVQADGKILVGGNFTTIKGVARLHMARLNLDGTVDTSFEPNPDSQVNAITVQSDNKILIGGYFLNLRPNGAAVSTVRNRIARLNADGSLDTFNPVAGGPVFAIKLQSDGKVLVGGAFLGFETGNRANIARINADGTLDANYNPSADKQVNAIVVQSDGKIIIGGSFTFLQPYNAPVVTVTTTNSDGSKTTSTTTTSFRRGIARLNTDGTVDTAFDPSPNNVVRALALQSDGKVIAGGLFTELLPNDETVATARNYIARIMTDGKVDPTYDLGVGTRVGNQVIALALQADGKLLMGGAFTTLQPAAPAGAPQVLRNQLARINTDGSVDSYAPNAGGPTGSVINSVTLQPDGRILVGGAFSTFGGTSSGNLARFNTESVPDVAFNPDPNGTVNAVANRISSGSLGTQLTNFAWLNSDGTLQTSFAPGASSQISGQVSVILRQADGKIILGGTIINLSGSTGNFIVRFNADGTLDTGFNPTIDGAVSAMALQPDGKILLGGSFLTVGGVSRQYVARVNPDGSLDTAFDPKANSTVNVILVRPDGKIYLGGSFTSLQPNGATSSSATNYLARINGDGSYDNTFAPNPNSTVYALALQPDGALVIGGAFNTVLAGGTSTTVLTRNHVARIKADNLTDTTFDPNASSTVLALALQADGKVILGGTFTFLQANNSATIVTRNYLARVNTDGSLDNDYDPNPNGSVVSLSIQTDGKLIVGGVFNTLQPAGSTVATSRNRIARVNTNGTVDDTFNPSPNGAIVTVAAQADGTVLAGGIFSEVEPTGSTVVGGAFTNIGGVALSNLALLNNEGSASASFAPNPNGTVYALAVRPDNRVLAAGTFTTIAGAARAGVAQLTRDGAIDGTFNAGASVSGGPAALLLQTDGKVLVGGSAVGFGGAPRGTLERLNADGSLDGSFNPSGLGAVNALALQADGKILVGGSGAGGIVRLNANGTTDGTFNAAANGAVAAIAVQTDGQIIVGGSFTSIGGAAFAYFARLNANGTADPTFQPNANGAVTALALQPAGKVLLGGGFTSVGGKPRYSLARVAMTTPASQAIDISNNFSTITWTRGGSGPTLTNATFEQSTDGRIWTALGSASRVGATDTWQLGGQSLTTGSVLFIRGRGMTANSQFGSSGVIETVRQFYSTSLPRITSATTANGTSGASFYYATVSNVSGATFGATGLPAGLSIDPVTGLISGTTSQTGIFPVTLTVTNSAGTGTATLMLVISPPGGGPAVSRFVNLSARAQVKATDPLIAGLVIGGTTSQTVLLRAIGPGLAGYGISTGIAHPRMQLYNSSNVLLTENVGWGGSSALAAVFAQVGAFPLAAGSADSALLVSLAPGAYSVVVSDTAGASGVALAEVYDTGTDSSASAPRLVNIAARATAKTDDTVLIGGFAVTGTAPKRILIRGVGPALGNYGISAFMTDPILSLYNSSNVLLAQNDNWGTPVTITAGQPAVTAAELILAAAQSGAPAYASGSVDAAIIVNLPPGIYSAQVKSAANTEGTALVEIYELP